MKPYSLTIEGLFSFFNKQEIDFEKLTEGGIFGIFGPTGAGKSSVLDSIVFSLYGATGRGDNHQVLNVKSKSANVNFVFSMLIDGCRRKFEVSRSLKRKKDGTAEQSAVLSEILNNGKIALCEGSTKVNSKIEQLIGLSLKEFKKCIAIPQGEFSSFIKATHVDQTLIMGRLFSLDELGDKLNKKLSSHLEIIEREKANFEGRLLGFNEVTKEREEFLKASKTEIELKLESLAVDINSLAKQKKSDEAILEKCQKQSEYEKKLASLSAQAVDFEIKRKDVELIKKAVEIYPKLEKTIALLKQEKEAITINLENENKFITAKKLLEIFNENYFSIKSGLEKDIIELAVKIEKAIPLKEEQEKFKNYQSRIKKLRENYSSVNESLNDNNKEITEHKAELEKIAKKILELKDKSKNIDSKISTLVLEKEKEISKAKHIIFNESNDKFNAGLKSAETQFKGVGTHFKDFKGYLEDGLAKTTIYTDTKNTLQPQDGIDSLSMEKIEIEKLKGKLEKETQDHNFKILNLSIQISKNQESILGIKTEGENLNELILQSKKIFSDAGADVETDINKFIEDAKLKLQAKNTDLKNLEQQKESANSGLLNCQTEFIKSAEALKLISRQRQETDKDDYIKQSGFNNVTEINFYYSKKDETEKLEKEIKRFDNNITELNVNIKTLKDELNGKNITAGRLQEIYDKYDKLNNEAKLLGENKAVIIEQLKKHKLDMAQLKSIEKEYAAVLKNYETAVKLKNAIKSKALMDFAVQEYFVDITLAASKKLEFLSDGQYELKYDNLFYVKDNLNGGELREVCTLSGGETFLVSLSLAVSLSEAIVSLSSRPIEFFFLDEGFGTLDNNLIDVVMTSLEKLVKTHFSIGLISHVPELKQRIINKLNLVKENGISKIVSDF